MAGGRNPLPAGGARAERASDEVLRHLAGAEVWLTSRVDGSLRFDGPPRDGDPRRYLDSTRAWMLERLPVLVARDPAVARTDSKGETWTLAKVLRRLVYHSLDHLHERKNDFEYGRALAGSFCKLAGRPTAFLGHNDEIAIGAMRGFQEGGLKLPRDVSVTGFNHQDICHMVSPTLTTVDQNIATTIETAAEVILSQLDKPLPAKPIVRTIEPHLVIGESTGPAKV